MLVEFLDKAMLKTIEVFMNNPARPMLYSEIMREGRYGMKDMGLVPATISKMVENEMIHIENPDEPDTNNFRYICNIRSRLLVGLMNLDIELVQRDLDFKKSMRAKSFTYQPRSLVLPQEQKVEVTPTPKEEKSEVIEEKTEKTDDTPPTTESA
jgi:hypothetical protein